MSKLLLIFIGEMGMSFALWFIVGCLVLPAIIYYTVKEAVQEGVYNALIKYDKYKNQSSK